MDAFLYQDLKSNDVSNYESTKKYWEKEIFNNNKYQFYSFYLNNELVGFTVYSGHLLVYLVVDPKYQGKGYGEYILNKSLREYCNKYNYKYINLYTYLINIKARNLYEKVGFKVVGNFCMSYYK